MKNLAFNSGKSRRWKLTVGGVIFAAVIGTTVGIVLRQTHDKEEGPIVAKEPNYGEYSSAAVSCDAPLCAQIGKGMLERNGSVADAAISTLLCMGVIHSQSMGIGGGFFMVLWSNGTAKVRKSSSS
jgi:hypothetical protein